MSILSTKQINLFMNTGVASPAAFYDCRSVKVNLFV